MTSGIVTPFPRGKQRPCPFCETQPPQGLLLCCHPALRPALFCPQCGYQEEFILEFTGPPECST
jgi:hypothetical protein